MNTPIVVLRNNDYCFLGILRSLAAAKAPVVPVIWDWPGAGPWHSETSRHFRNAETIPNPVSDPTGAVRALRAIGERLQRQSGERPFLIPSSDTGLMVVLDHYEELSMFRLIGSPNFDRPRRDVAHKGHCATLLAAAGVAIPRTRRCEKPSDVDRAVRGVPIPALFKPAVKDYGMRFYREHRMAKAVTHTDRPSLRRELRRAVAAGHPLVVQEQIPLCSVQDEVPFYAYVDRHHRIRLASTGIKELIIPEPFGTAAALRLTHHKELLPLAQGVARALSWRGPLMIEFMRDPRDGRWKVIEVNTRPWLFNDFFRQCGLDYVGFLVADLRDQLQHYPALTTPSAELLAKRPIHIDPLALLRAAEPEGAASRVAIQLRSFAGSNSYTYQDSQDPDPYRSRSEEFRQLLDERQSQKREAA
ncbi:MAG: hypothetical protein AAGF12_09875 [Myxococcota bacterium]